jgi:hypothetical protein
MECFCKPGTPDTFYINTASAIVGYGGEQDRCHKPRTMRQNIKRQADT